MVFGEEINCSGTALQFESADTLDGEGMREKIGTPGKIPPRKPCLRSGEGHKTSCFEIFSRSPIADRFRTIQHPASNNPRTDFAPITHPRPHWWTSRRTHPSGGTKAEVRVAVAVSPTDWGQLFSICFHLGVSNSRRVKVLVRVAADSLSPSLSLSLPLSLSSHFPIFSHPAPSVLLWRKGKAGKL